jgi:hypothetical protein
VVEEEASTDAIQELKQRMVNLTAFADQRSHGMFQVRRGSYCGVVGAHMLSAAATLLSVYR